MSGILIVVLIVSHAVIYGLGRYAGSRYWYTKWKGANALLYHIDETQAFDSRAAQQAYQRMVDRDEYY